MPYSLDLHPASHTYMGGSGDDRWEIEIDVSGGATAPDSSLAL
jgi:hypothetical protein